MHKLHIFDELLIRDRSRTSRTLASLRKTFTLDKGTCFRRYGLLFLIITLRYFIITCDRAFSVDFFPTQLRPGLFFRTNTLPGEIGSLLWN